LEIKTTKLNKDKFLYSLNEALPENNAPNEKVETSIFNLEIYNFTEQFTGNYLEIQNTGDSIYDINGVVLPE